jgi:hypothetical protein
MTIPRSASVARTSTGRRWVPAVAIVSVAVLLAAACGSTGTDSSGDASHDQATTTLVMLDSAQLERALLTASDLPAGWYPAGSGSGSSSLLGTDQLCPTAAQALKNEEHDNSEAQFSQGMLGPFFFQGLAAAPDAEAHLADLKTVVDSCVGQTWTTEISGTSVSFTLTDQAGAGVGDESFAFRMVGEGGSDSSSATLTFDFAFVRNGSVVESYGGASVRSPDGSGTLDADQFAGLIRTGNDKVTAALASAPDEATSTSTSTTVGPPLTKAEFLARANGVCRATKDQMKTIDIPYPSKMTDAETRDYYVKFGAQAIPMLRDMLAQLRTLTPPVEDQARITAAWKEMEALFRSLEADPVWMMIQVLPEDKEMYDYGLTDCFVDHVDLL